MRGRTQRESMKIYSTNTEESRPMTRSRSRALAKAEQEQRLDRKTSVLGQRRTSTNKRAAQNVRASPEQKPSKFAKSSARIPRIVKQDQQKRREPHVQRQTRQTLNSIVGRSQLTQDPPLQEKVLNERVCGANRRTSVRTKRLNVNPANVKANCNQHRPPVARPPKDEFRIFSPLVRRQVVAKRSNVRPPIHPPAQAEPVDVEMEENGHPQLALDNRIFTRTAGGVVMGEEEEILPDIDSKDAKNPLMCAQYAVQTYAHYKQIEPKYLVAPNYMEKQKEITSAMRSILVDWLVQVHARFRLMPETLYLAINYMDRYLEKKPTPKNRLQLVGCCAMMIAAKYEEVWAPEIHDYVRISDCIYTKQQFLRMEFEMWTILNMDLGTPTIYTFLARHLKACGSFYDKKTALLTAYIGELALLDIAMLRYRYSLVSAAACCVARLAVGEKDIYPHALAKHAGYRFSEVLECVQDLIRLMQEAKDCKRKERDGRSRVGPLAVVNKYMEPKFGCVAEISIPRIT